jgi:hypothetical protein
MMGEEFRVPEDDALDAAFEEIDDEQLRRSADETYQRLCTYAQADPSVG